MAYIEHLWAFVEMADQGSFTATGKVLKRRLTELIADSGPVLPS